MSYWQGVRYLLLQDMKNARWKNLTLVLMVMYVAIFSFDTFIKTLVEEVQLSTMITEYITIMVFSAVGIVATHLYSFGGYKKDLLVERIRYWRTLPIKQDQITWSRIIGVIFYTTIAILFYYMLLSIVMIVKDVSFDAITIALHGLQLLAISVMLNFIFLYCELVLSLKTYNVISWIYPLVLFGLMILYSSLARFSLLVEMYKLAERHPLIALIGSIIVIVGSSGLAFKIITPQFRKRNI